MEFAERMGRAAEVAKENMANLEPGEQLLPVFIGITALGQEILIAPDFNDEETKQLSLRMIRQLFAKYSVTGYIHISEAWVRQAKDMNDVNNGPRPSDSPDRREVVLIAGVDSETNHSYHSIYPILRDANGKASLGDPETPAHSFSGRMFDLLKS